MDGILSIGPRTSSSFSPARPHLRQDPRVDLIARGGDRLFARASAAHPNMQEVRPTFNGRGAPGLRKAYAKIAGSFQAKRQKAVGRFVIDQALAAGKRRSVALRPAARSPARQARRRPPTKRSSRRFRRPSAAASLLHLGARPCREIGSFPCLRILILEG